MANSIEKRILKGPAQVPPLPTEKPVPKSPGVANKPSNVSPETQQRARDVAAIPLGRPLPIAARGPVVTYNGPHHIGKIDFATTDKAISQIIGESGRAGDVDFLRECFAARLG